MTLYRKIANLLLLIVVGLFVVGVFLQTIACFENNSYGGVFIGNVLAGLVGNGFALWIGVTLIDWVTSRRASEAMQPARKRTYRDLASCSTSLLQSLIAEFPIPFSTPHDTKQLLSVLARGVVEPIDFAAVDKLALPLLNTMLAESLTWRVMNNPEMIDKLHAMLDRMEPESQRICGVICPRFMEAALCR